MLVSVFSLLSYTAEGMPQVNGPLQAEALSGQTAAVPKKRISALSMVRTPRFVKTKRDWRHLSNLGEKIDELVKEDFKDNTNPITVAERALQLYGSIKGAWTPDEDQKITEWVRTHGAKSWPKLVCTHFQNPDTGVPIRTGKQCRERWYNHLDPNPNSKPWTTEEDQRLRKLHNQLGNQWGKISALMIGRSDNAVKNRWNSTLKKQPVDEFGEPISKPQKKQLSLQSMEIQTINIPQPALQTVETQTERPLNPRNFVGNVIRASNQVQASFGLLASNPLASDPRIFPLFSGVYSSLGQLATAVNQMLPNQPRTANQQANGNNYGMRPINNQ